MIIVSNSDGNTSKYVDTVTIFSKNLKQKVNDPKMTFDPISVQARQKLHFQPCFDQNFSSQDANFPNFCSQGVWTAVFDMVSDQLCALILLHYATAQPTAQHTTRPLRPCMIIHKTKQQIIFISSLLVAHLPACDL